MYTEGGGGWSLRCCSVTQFFYAAVFRWEKQIMVFWLYQTFQQCAMFAFLNLPVHYMHSVCFVFCGVTVFRPLQCPPLGTVC